MYVLKLKALNVCIMNKIGKNKHINFKVKKKQQNKTKESGS